MYSRRCTYCQKLQQVDMRTRLCSYCGRDLSPQLPSSLRQKSIPPASSHRAGHTFGLHPEDQPYQSSMMLAQHSPSNEDELSPRLKADPDYIVFPDTEEVFILKARRRAALARSSQSLPPRAKKVVRTKMPGFVLRPVKKVARIKSEQPVLSLMTKAHTQRLVPVLPAPFFSSRVISWLLTLSCIIFLLATSIIAFVLIGKRATIASAVVQVSPDTLRANDTFMFSGRGFSLHDQMSFYHDNQQPLLNAQGKLMRIFTDANGQFSIQVQVPGSWGVGSHAISAVDGLHAVSIVTHITILAPSVSAPVLQISPLKVHFSGEAPGIVSSQTLTLTNIGGGQVFWSVTSDQPWLRIMPTSASFAGSQSVRVTANRGNLVPQDYIGDLIFTQKGATTSVLTIPVSMEVTSLPPDLMISTTALTYAASTSKNPDHQFITLHNSGNRDGGWSSSFSTPADTSWIILTPDHGILASGADQTIMVSAQSKGLLAGSYQGVLNFAGDISAQVNTSMSVVAAGNLVVSPLALDFTGLVGQPLAAKQVILQNSDEVSLTWQSQVTTVDQGNWLQVTSAHGSLKNGEQAPVSISINSQGMSAGSYQGKITFISSSGSDQPIAVSLIISAATVSAIHTQPSALTFVAASGSDPAGQTIVVTNTGDVVLQWAASAEGAESDVLMITPNAGTLALHQSVILTISVHLPVSSSGFLSSIIVLNTSHNGSTTVSQRIPVNITINSAAPSPARSTKVDTRP